MNGPSGPFIDIFAYKQLQARIKLSIKNSLYIKEWSLWKISLRKQK